MGTITSESGVHVATTPCGAAQPHRPPQPTIFRAAMERYRNADIANVDINFINKDHRELVAAFIGDGCTYSFLARLGDLALVMPSCIHLGPLSQAIVVLGGKTPTMDKITCSCCGVANHDPVDRDNPSPIKSAAV